MPNGTNNPSKFLPDFRERPVALEILWLLFFGAFLAAVGDTASVLFAAFVLFFFSWLFLLIAWNEEE